MLVELLGPLTGELQKYAVCAAQCEMEFGVSSLGEAAKNSTARGVRDPLDVVFFFPVRLMLWSMVVDVTMYTRPPRRGSNAS